MDWVLDRHAEVVDHHVRFIAHWHGRQRHVFVATALVEALAGRPLVRAEAEAYVGEHADRFVEAAVRRGSSNEAVIVLEDAADLT